MTDQIDTQNMSARSCALLRYSIKKPHVNYFYRPCPTIPSFEIRLQRQQVEEFVFLCHNDPNPKVYMWADVPASDLSRGVIFVNFSTLKSDYKPHILTYEQLIQLPPAVLPRSLSVKKMREELGHQSHEPDSDLPIPTEYWNERKKEDN